MISFPFTAIVGMEDAKKSLEKWNAEPVTLETIDSAGVQALAANADGRTAKKGGQRRREAIGEDHAKVVALIAQLPQRAGKAQLAFLEFPQHAGEVAAGPAGEMPGRFGRDDRHCHGRIFPAHGVASLRP